MKAGELYKITRETGGVEADVHMRIARQETFYCGEPIIIVEPSDPLSVPERTSRSPYAKCVTQHGIFWISEFVMQEA